jgi:hypothetical protein
MTPLKNIGQTIIIVILLLVGLGIFILFSPLIILWNINNNFDERAFNKKYIAFLQEIDGMKFFCYNNNTKSQNYIEGNILPILQRDVQVIFLDGKIPKSDYETKFISRMLYSIRNKKGFPYLLKVSNGQLIDESVNNDFYNTMNQGKDINILSKKINLFFN